MATTLVASPPAERARDLSIDYLRTTLTLMVIAHHSSLAYTTFARFNKQHIFESTAPVVDSARWIFFDYAENFNDVFFMSLMFFVSGLFVYPALRRHGTWGFIRERLLRLGVPFVFAVVFLMPIAYYASWQLTGRSTGFVNFYKRLAQDRFAGGPEWFIWVLLAFGVALALLLIPFQRSLPAAARYMAKLRNDPLATFLTIFLIASLAYLPLLARYGFGAWTALFTSPFSFQIPRIGLYAMWFVFGFLAGTPGIDHGLLSREGPLARHWRLWMWACILAYNTLIFVPRIHPQPKLEAVLWVLSCVTSCFAFLAIFRGITLTSRAWMNSLARSAYVMYLVHYVYLTWTQRLMLDLPIHAALKFLFVFLSTTLLSWLTAQALLRIPKLKSIL